MGVAADPGRIRRLVRTVSHAQAGDGEGDGSGDVQNFLADSTNHAKLALFPTLESVMCVVVNKTVPEAATHDQKYGQLSLAVLPWIRFLEGMYMFTKTSTRSSRCRGGVFFCT